MEDLSQKLRRLEVGAAGDLSSNSYTSSQNGPTEYPFDYQTMETAPRYLFRVFTEKQYLKYRVDQDEWMISPAAFLASDFDTPIDIAGQPRSLLATILNKHLQGSAHASDEFPTPDFASPFLSWTSSLLYALQLAIYKHKQERLPFSRIYLCLVDTELFLPSTFIEDVILVGALRGEHNPMDDDPDHEPGTPRTYEHWMVGCRRTCGDTGIETRYDVCDMAGYFGEYITQGQIYIKDRSAVVACDNIINDYLFTLIPRLEPALLGGSNLAKALKELRAPFLKFKDSRRITRNEHRVAMKIAGEFPARWRVVMLCHLLALQPRPVGHPGYLPMDLNGVKDGCPVRLDEGCDAENFEALHFVWLMNHMYWDYFEMTAHLERQDIARNANEVADPAPQDYEAVARPHGISRHRSTYFAMDEWLHDVDNQDRGAEQNEANVDSWIGDTNLTPQSHGPGARFPGFSRDRHVISEIDNWADGLSNRDRGLLPNGQPRRSRRMALGDISNQVQFSALPGPTDDHDGDEVIMDF